MPDEIARLEEARSLLDEGDLDRALAASQPLTTSADRDVAAEAWLLIGTARYRLDDEPGALSAWRQAADSGGRAAWAGWREVAGQLVRDGELEEAIAAYREAERRAPALERGALANRIGWLLKETGHDFEARRQFNRARGAYGSYLPIVTYAVLAITTAVFLVDLAGPAVPAQLFAACGGSISECGLIWGVRVADGEWWRIITSAFLHGGFIHFGLNMYILFLFGPLVERMYGHLEFLGIYLLSASGGSVLTILVDPQQRALGASGAIFGLFGLMFVVGRRHHALIGREGRAMMAQIGILLALNLVITFVFVSIISWTGHVGGLAVGLILGFLLPPTGVATLGALWRTPAGEPMDRTMPAALRAGVYVMVASALLAGGFWAVLRIG